MEIEYIGEQAWWGQLGHFSVIVAFVTALFGVVAAYFRVKEPDLDGKWKDTARRLYFLHSLAVVSIFLTLLLMLINHRFEYQYVWQHSKRDLNMNYILAALWEGQEGSTLLWLTWHAILGWFVIRKGGEWEGPVIGVVSLVQVFLSMMLLGIYFGNTHIGASPFDLIRLREENFGLPWTSIPDYLQKIPMFADGRGLNPLLQNYWMTIHPPTLFCGFALVTFPFAYAIAGLWIGKMYTWQKPALTWTFVGVMVLGTGILMGGAWAYESLSFGGFWAWDPVENASLVPWMILVGAAHVMLIYKIKGRSLYTTFILTIAAFLLIVYSTFLTKSGILSDSSVHAFTEEGLNQELAAFMCFFLWLSVCFLSRSLLISAIYTAISIFVWMTFVQGHPANAIMIFLLSSLVILIFSYWKKFPKEEKEEELWSREFWMFIGALVLVVAAGQITFFTSSPVVNKFLATEIIHGWIESISTWFSQENAEALLNAKIAPKKPHFYNTWQAGFAILIVVLMGVGQFFKYRNTKFKEMFKGVMWPMIISIVLGTLFAYFYYFDPESRMLPIAKRNLFGVLAVLITGIIFSIVANGAYFMRIIKGGIRKAGASVAHIGFGLLMLGAVISTSKKDTISMNTSSTDLRSLTKDGNNGDNIYLRKGDTLPMGDYMVTYQGREKQVRNGTDYILFHVDFFEQTEMQKSGEHLFRLSPFVQINKFMGNAPEPDTRHYLHKDIYSFVKFGSSYEDAVVDPTLFSDPKNNTVGIGDTLYVDNAIVILKGLSRVVDTALIAASDTNTIGVQATFELIDRGMKRRTLTPIYYANRVTGSTYQVEALDTASGTKLIFWKVRPETGTIDVYSSEQLSKKADFVVIEVSEFPAINVLWLGCLIMIAGTFIALLERIRVNKSEPTAEVPKENP